MSFGAGPEVGPWIVACWFAPMELPVTIEGVETGLDMAFLEELSGGHAQGYAFSPPLDPTAAAAFAGPGD